MVEEHRILWIRTILAMAGTEPQRKAFIDGYNGRPRPPKASAAMRETYDRGLQVQALLATPTPDGTGSEEEVLPCDVKLPPATTIRAGCSFDTLRLALNMPGRPRHFEGRKSLSERQAHRLMMPGFGSVSAPSDGQSYGMSSTSKRDEEQAGETLKVAVTAVMARCEVLEDEALKSLVFDHSEHATGFYRGQKSVAKSIRRELHDLTRAALAAAHKEQS